MEDVGIVDSKVGSGNGVILKETDNQVDKDIVGYEKTRVGYSARLSGTKRFGLILLKASMSLLTVKGIIRLFIVGDGER